MNARSDTLRGDAQPPPGQMIGALLVQAGQLTPEQVEQVIFRQRATGLLFGEAARDLGLIGEAALRGALMRQFDAFSMPDSATAIDRCIVMAHEPWGRTAEALRCLRSQLALGWQREGGRALAVSGLTPRSGCSVLAANLAVAFAQAGQRTILVDGNLRHPQQHLLFGMEQSGSGFSSVLAGRSPLKQAMRGVAGLPELLLLPAGPPPPNPQELLAGTRFGEIMQTLPSSCDVLLMDTPPLGPCADAQIIASALGSSLLSLRRHRASRAALLRARSSLESTGVNVLGVVFNG